MPVEKYFLMSLKDVLIEPFDVNIKGVESLSSNSPMIYVTFTTVIDKEKYPGFFGASIHCLNKLHTKMRLTTMEDGGNNTLSEKFLKEIANSLIKQMRSYIFELDKRVITISEATICADKGKTSYGLTRYFLMDDGDMSMSY